MILSVVVSLPVGASEQEIALALDACASQAASYAELGGRIETILVLPLPAVSDEFLVNLAQRSKDLDIMVVARRMTFQDSVKVGMERAIGERIVAIPSSEIAALGPLIKGVGLADFVSLKYSKHELNITASLLRKVLPDRVVRDALRPSGFSVSRLACSSVLGMRNDESFIGTMMEALGLSVAEVALAEKGPRPSLRVIGARLVAGVMSNEDQFLRFVSVLGVLGALGNLVYAGWIIAANLLMSDLQPGWTTTGLHMSAMFFLLSLMMSISAEYLVQMRRAVDVRVGGHARVISSQQKTYQDLLNVEVARAPDLEG